MRLFGPIFWAIILILVGVVVILNQTFGWHISVFAIVFGVILISIGISIITKPSSASDAGIFTSGTVRNINSKENSYIFSSVTINIEDFNQQNMNINSVFSNVKVHTNGKSVKIKSSGAFSSTIFPDKSSLAFGERVYERDGENTIYIVTNCVFGSIIID